MSTLLHEIRRISTEAAHELERAGFETDSDIRSLDRQDLLELLPGKDKLRVRKEIHKVICRLPQQSPTYETIFKDLKELLQSDLSAGGFSDKEALLGLLRKMKEFAEALIDLLETKRANNAYSERHVPPPGARVADSKNSIFSLFPPWTSRFLPFQGTQATSSSIIPSNSAVAVGKTIQTFTKVPVMFKLVVSGKTLEKHVDVIERLNGPVPGHLKSLQLKEVQRDEDSSVTIVFCPVVSRLGTDIGAALQDISSDKPVIVAAMYHMHTPMSAPAPRTDSRVQLGVNVFFHETVGLLNCSQNQDAINEVKTKLLEISTKKSCP